MQKKSSFWLDIIRQGVLGGTIAVLICLVGIVVALRAKFIISGIITMGQILAIAPIIAYSYQAVRRHGKKGAAAIMPGVVSGFFGGLLLALLVLVINFANIRDMFVNASPELLRLLTFNQPFGLGILLLIVFTIVMGLLVAVIYILPPRIGYAITQAILWTVLVGLARDLIMTVIRNWGPVYYVFKWMFATSGLSILGALVVFLLVGGLQYWRYGRPKQQRQSIAFAKRPIWVRWTIVLVAAVILIFLPMILGIFFSDILDTVGLFILMGLGLNIVVGFAGLLDLGYVAFYAIGAYMMGVLTSPELTANPLTYWQALPFALGVCFISGLILGLPVLKMRGDYLAIVTLGFGEIVRLLVLSDWLRPWLGGSQGIQHIAHPVIGPIDFGSQQMLYYVILVGVAITGFIAWRLKDSRLGRAWMALREDEDVATAMGINNVVTKLLAFATGAFFAGLSGTLYAAKLSSAYPQSFQFLVSINVISLIIIGGIGSIPGVVVGGLVLMGLPEVLREFAEYRYLVYGAVLVFMMLTRPEGLWPEERRRLELHEMDVLAHGPETLPEAENPGERI